MAKMLIEVDTTSKNVMVSIDGTEVPNVEYVSVTNEENGEYFYVNVTQKLHDKVNNLVTRTMYSAASKDNKFAESKDSRKELASVLLQRKVD